VGIYDTPVDETALVHNLEHGGVVVQYGSDVPASTVQQITQWYQDNDPNGIVVAPIWPNIQATPPPDASKKIFVTVLDAPHDVHGLRRRRVQPLP
jgi:hypothetical protein